MRPPPLSPPPLAPAPTLHAARAQEGRPAFSFNENFNIARDGRKGAGKLEQLYIRHCMPAISLWPSVAWPTYSHASRFDHWYTTKELRTCRLCFALTAQKMDAEVHAVLLASLHARLRLEETIPEDKCDDFIKDLLEKGEYGTAAGEVNFESSEKRFFVEEMLLSELRESRAERGWLCGCKMRFPIWREGGAYGGCRDCFDAQLVDMIDTRALGADDPRKKAWVDARTYEWDVHYFYPMADEAARELMQSGTFTESHKEELRQRLRAARAADVAAEAEAEAVAEAAEEAAREKALAEAAGWAAAAAESAGRSTTPRCRRQPQAWPPRRAPLPLACAPTPIARTARRSLSVWRAWRRTARSRARMRAACWCECVRGLARGECDLRSSLSVARGVWIVASRECAGTRVRAGRRVCACVRVDACILNHSLCEHKIHHTLAVARN